MNISEIETPLGTMIAVADDSWLYLLEFECQKGRLKKGNIATGKTAATCLVEKELSEYFAGKRQVFEVPLFRKGTPFQLRVWDGLTRIGYGKTISYADLAESAGNPKAYRAAALANSVNPFAIIVPCHRVINTGGKLGGYAGGIERKRWLLKHEQECGQNLFGK